MNEAKYSLWTMPRSEWKSPLAGVVLDTTKEISVKELEEAVKRSREKFACFKTRPISAEMLARVLR